MQAAFAPPPLTARRKRSPEDDEITACSSNKRAMTVAIPAALITPLDQHQEASVDVSRGSTGTASPKFMLEPMVMHSQSSSWSLAHPIANRSHHHHHHHHHHHQELMEELARDNALLRHELNEKNTRIDNLQKQVEELQEQIIELRQLPVGKISQIPVA